ncbi:prion-inhibition and propagation-domain-containing protein [Dichotomopilus funicola]|uniref:Prion-inhibition and propagation-domain-containing protein n=1 Tax=Dichotomopilus funicola TaxID=1934379 RepID=A0AAN6UYF3_9PEZI|nr:prion-inhibition and propagation-domain-containing protein [Dichotomopilus funicola]
MEARREGRSISQLAFIEQESERFKATLLFASILRSIYNHPDWSELHAFFTKRYSKSQTLSNRDACKLTAPADAIHNAGKTVVVDFNTDPSSVGLPRDLPAQLAAACRAARSTLVGPDPQPCSIGPAISVAMGGGAYMGLMYMGQPPGKYPERTLIAGQWYGWEGGKHGVVAGAIATTNKGGRGRSWGEWADLWRAIAYWVYEYDATSLELHFLSVHSYKYRPSDQERRNMGFGLRVPRQYLSTDAISAADAIRIEWDYLEFEFEREEQEAFRARFGRKDADHKKTLEALVRPASLSHWDRLDYEDVSPVALKPCPDSFCGADWEAWLLSIEGGNVVVAKTPFQALWAVMLLSQFPLVIKIVSKQVADFWARITAGRQARLTWSHLSHLYGTYLTRSSRPESSPILCQTIKTSYDVISLKPTVDLEHYNNQNMEAAGLAIGVFGLAGLYSTCIELLDALSAAARFGVDRELLQTKLEVERVRLMIWGDSVGLTEVTLDSSKSAATEDDLAVIDESMQRPALRTAVAGLLACFVRVFEDVEKLQKRYGLVRQPESKRKGTPDALMASTAPATATATSAAAVASSSSSTPDRPTRAILSATFRKTYASFQDRTTVAQKQATPLTRARWAVVDEPKFRALISELKAINDPLMSLLPAVSNKTRVRMRAEIMQSNDVNQLQNLVSAADEVADLVSETASLRLEMLSTTGESVPRRLQPRLVHVSDPAAAPRPTAETPQPTVYSKPDSLSCYAWVSGQWEVPDLSEIQPVFHPAFNLVFIPDSILGVAKNVLEVDVAADPRYAGWSPGSTSLTGFAREMTFWRQAVKEVEQSQKGWLRATNTPALTSNFALQRWNSTMKNGLGEDWTEKKGHDQLRELLGPSDYTWLDPEEGFEMRHQISDLLADMRMSPVPSLESTGSIGCLANSDPNRGGGNFGMIDFLFQMVKAREVTLRIARSQSKWHGGITARIVYDLVAAELWSTKLEYREDTDAFQVTRHAKEEQIDGIVKFAKEMKWPYVDEIHDTAANLRDPDTENTAGIDMCVWDWINGLFLPGALFQSSLIGVFSALSPTLRNCLPRATIQPRKGSYGIVYPQASY